MTKQVDPFSSEADYIKVRDEVEEKAKIYYDARRDLWLLVERVANVYRKARQHVLYNHSKPSDKDHNEYDLDNWYDHGRVMFVCVSYWGDEAGKIEYEYEVPRELLWSTNLEEDAIRLAKEELKEELKKREEREAAQKVAEDDKAYRQYVELKRRFEK